MSIGIARNDLGLHLDRLSHGRIAVLGGFDVSKIGLPEITLLRGDICSLSISAVKKISTNPQIMQLCNKLFRVHFRLAHCQVYTQIQCESGFKSRTIFDYPYNMIDDASNYIYGAPLGLNVAVPLNGPVSVNYSLKNIYTNSTGDAQNQTMSSERTENVKTGSAALWSAAILRSKFMPVDREEVDILRLTYVPIFVKRDLRLVDYYQKDAGNGENSILSYLLGRGDRFPLRYKPSDIKVELVEEG